MKIKYLVLAIFPFMLSACQSNDLQKIGDTAVSILQESNINKTLASYHWSTNTGSSTKPLTLSFSDQSRLSVSTTCNNMMGSFKIEGNSIITTQLASTMMACSPPAMEQEKIASDIFSDRKANFVLDIKDVNQPTLALTAADGKTYTFTGKMTPETQYQTQGETIFLEISPETKECSGVGKQTCLQVREIKYSESGLKTQVDKDWTLFYDNIQGFTHSANQRQIIRVKRYENRSPAADQSKYAYVHDLTVESSTVNSK